MVCNVAMSELVGCCVLIENSCQMDWVPCPSGTGCLPAEWLCDGDPDCHDGSDENHQLCNSKYASVCSNQSRRTRLSQEPTFETYYECTAPPCFLSFPFFVSPHVDDKVLV